MDWLLRKTLGLGDYKGKKVYVGLSGGVDSSVAAYILKKLECEVVGVFIQIWVPGAGCVIEEDMDYAMRVACALDVPFKVINLSDVYKDKVVDYMVGAYEAGITPNPDMVCNRFVKFGAFAECAFLEGADYVATGHYARLRGGRLLRGVDVNKDQSYFLAYSDKGVLRRAIFPLGSLRKGVVRAIARFVGLPTYDRKDSQGLCFLGHVDMFEFLSGYIEPCEGDVVDVESGEIVGRHKGVAFYTIGQRRGFESYGSKVYFVVKKDVENNVLYVSDSEGVEGAGGRRLRCVKFNFLEELSEGDTVGVQVRYRGDVVGGIVDRVDGEDVEVVLDKDVLWAPGQFAVLYDGDVCLGGGVIRG